MDYPGKMKWAAGIRWSRALRYGLAFVSVAAALGLSLAFSHFHLPQPFGSFAISAIAITFWYAGTAPGIFAAVLSSVVRDYLFEPNTSTEIPPAVRSRVSGLCVAHDAGGADGEMSLNSESRSERRS